MKAKGWRTVLFNIALAAAGSPEVLALLTPEQALYVGLIGNVLLRSVTSTPIGQSEPATAPKSEPPQE
jgi:hypothetical protein